MTADATDRRRSTAIPDLPRTSSYEAAQEVLRSPRFTSTMHNAHTFEIFGGAVLTLDGKEHRNRRQSERELFLTNARSRYEDVVMTELQRLLASTTPDGNGVLEVGVCAVARPIFLEVTARIVGIDRVDTPERTDELLEIVNGLRGVAGSDFISGDKEAAVQQAQEVKELFRHGFFTESKRARRALLSSGQQVGHESADLLTLLLQAYPEWDDDQYIRECLFFLAASGGTQLNAIGHVLVELDRWVAGSAERRQRLTDRAFLQRAISETMRHHPPLPMLVRRAVADVTLHDGTFVAEGTDIAVDLFSANLDPRAWGEDAAHFDPDRVIPRGLLDHGVTFALGPHTCPGRPVAVGDAHNDTDRPPWGIVTRIVAELYRRGGTLSPARPPEASSAYTFPVWGEVWMRLDAAAPQRSGNG